MSQVAVYGDELYHHGVKGMKWGVRRYQNHDGSLTAAGQRHRNSESGSQPSSRDTNRGYSTKNGLSEGQKKAIKVGVTVAGTALAAYGTYKLASYINDNRIQKASEIAQAYLDKNRLSGYSVVDNRDLSPNNLMTYFQDSKGNNASYTNKFTTKAERDNFLRKYNSSVYDEAKRQAEEFRNTKLDKVVSKIADTGDVMKERAKNTAFNVKVKATALKNRVKSRNGSSNTSPYYPIYSKFDKEKAQKMVTARRLETARKNNIPRPKSYSLFSKLSEREKQLVINNPISKEQALREKRLKNHATKMKARR